MNIKKLSVLCASISALLLVSPLSYAKEPLIQDGKSADSKIYRRVLTTPSCVLKSDKNASTGETVAAFSRFYVYEDDGKNLSVGPDSTGTVSGVISRDCAVEWKMQTALMFTNPANRDRALIFDNKSTIDEIINSPDPYKAAAPLYAKASKDEPADGIISIEPKNFTDYTKQFYLLPILDSEEVMFDDGNYVRELKIASVTEKNPSGSAADEENAIKAFKSALVFVIDSSISMQPYIDRTKQSINTIIEKIKENGLEDSVHFGLVSFRASTKAVPGLEYVSKVYVNPGDAKTKEDFASKLADLNQAKVSSKYFDEDSFAGINSALDKIDWSEYGGRYIVLVTDAGGISGNDRLSTTGLDSKELRLEAKHKGVAIYALHLLTDTPNAKKDQPKAKVQYEDLTFNDTINKSLYYPVAAGDVNRFGKKIDELSNNIADQVKRATLGLDAIGTAPDDPADEENAQMQEDTIRLGYAMQLAYLGKTLGTKAPDFLEGWISDKDLKKHDYQICTPVVLLTKNDLSALYDATRHIDEAFNKGVIDSESMFSELRAIAVNMGRDPALLNQNTASKIKDLGILGEFLDGLPYKSDIQNLDEESWAALGPDEQNLIIVNLENKLNYYQKCNEDTDRWVKLNEKDDISNAVYPIPLEELP